ncbi:MAG TPA: endonuclease domain-containing protein [Chloroflexota bacterium]|nr:endonuclease domain-containing protein [Chloroflexota bacterium]
MNYRGNYLLSSLVNRCRLLRLQSTDAEQLLWAILRNRQVAGAKFRCQHQFGLYILDFYCPEQHLCVEADGGGHFEAAQAAYDAERKDYLARQGVRVLRFTDREILLSLESVAEVI